MSTPASADGSLALQPLLTDPARLARWIRDRDPQVDAARARAEMAVAARRQAGVRPNPLGGIVLGATNPPSPRLGLTSTMNLNLGLSEQLEIGKRGPRIRAASLRVDEAANLETARSLQTLEEVRRDNHDLSGADYARIGLDTQQLALQLSRADADVTTARAACSATLLARCSVSGLDDAAVIDAAAPLPAVLPATEPALEHRPARQAARREAEGLGQDAELADHRAIPDPTIGVGYTYDNLAIAGNQAQTILVAVSIPLPLFDRGDHDAAAARAGARAVRLEDRALVRDARGEIEALVAHRELLLQLLDTRYELFTVRVQLRQLLGLDDAASRELGGTS